MVLTRPGETVPLGPGATPRGWEPVPDYHCGVHDPSKAKYNIIVTHTHLAQAGFSPDGHWNCIGMSCMRDQRRTAYTQERATKFPRWSNAFVVMNNGYFRLFTRKRTDWRTELGDDLYAALMERAPSP